jgi:hypothetical protein
VLAASIKAMMMVTVSTSETPVKFYRTNGATTQRTVIFFICFY